MLLKSEKQVAFDEVNRLLRLSGDQYHDAARRMHDQSLSDWCTRMAENRHHFSEQLEEQIRQMGELPIRPDPDKELLTNMFVGLKEAFTANHAVYELEQRDLLENELAEAVAKARSENQETAMEQLLAALAHDIVSTRQQIKERLAQIASTENSD